MAKRKKPAGTPRTPTPRPARRKPRGRLAAGVVAAIVAAVVAAVGLNTRKPSPPPAIVPDGEMRADDMALREEAIQTAKQLVADFPKDAAALGLMGTVHNQFGNSAEAETWWRACFELHPDRADVYDVLAQAQLEKGEYADVVELSQQTMAASPAMPGVRRYLAAAYLEMGQLDDALDAIREELKRSPADNEAYLLLGRIELQRKAYQDAMTAYSKALELRANDSRCYFGLASAAARLGQTEKAAEYQANFETLRAAEDAAAQTKRRATEVIAPAGPTLAATLVDAGSTYYAHNRNEQAQACWRRAVELEPTARNYFLLGQASYKLRDRPAALAAITRAFELDPTNPQIKQAYEQVQQGR